MRAVGVAARAAGAVILRLAVFAVASSAAAIILAWLLQPFRAEGTFGLFATALATFLGLVAGTWLTLTIFEKRSLAAVGLHAGPTASVEMGWGLALGAAITTAAGAVLLVFGWLSIRDGDGVVLEGLWQAVGLTGFVAVAAAFEELLFRGYPFQLIWKRLGLPVALGLSAGLFALAHLGNPELTPLAFVNLALAGLLLALAYVRTRSLWLPIGVHAGWNWVLAVPLDQPVSGFVFGMPGYDVVETGPDLFTGGAFGPEGGLVVTGVTAAAIAWMTRTCRLRPAPAALAAGLLPDTAPAAPPAPAEVRDG